MADKGLQKTLVGLLTKTQKGLHNVRGALSKLMHALGVSHFCAYQFIIHGRKKGKKKCLSTTRMWNIQERVSESLASRNLQSLKVRNFERIEEIRQ